MEKPHGACRVKLKQWALQRGQRSRPGSDCLYSGSGHERATEKKKKSALWRQISGSWLLSTVSGWWWVCCDGVTLGSGGWLFRVPLPLASGSVSAWFCQRTGDWGGEAVREGGWEAGYARSSVHVRSTGDLGSWKGDICSTSCQANSATLIVPPTPFLQKLSACVAAGSPI